ncbi:MAG: DNA double-strand break repair nuclease NurA [Chloroflexi bacterium]|nr:DNA double-strand break repair nuclease NurA [Chloroflexota bacterium]
MLSLRHVWRALQESGDVFVHYQRDADDALQRYRALLDQLAAMSVDALRRALAGLARPGALPSLERTEGQSLVRTFGRQWDNHEQARAWALAALRDTPTIAVDGSQITPSRDFSLPVGAVQVAWFENPHTLDGAYTKDLRFEVLGPEALAPDQTEGDTFPDLQVNLRRFELECEVLVEAMQRYRGRTPAPLCLLDGSFVISFAAQMGPELQTRYVCSVRRLLDASEETRVPVVGYIDSSYARDLVSLLAHLENAEPPRSISDALLLGGAMHWGDRSEAFVCARDDRVFVRQPDLDYYDRVLLVYCKTTADHPPARLDVPRWVLEAGDLDRVIDLVRAECVVGAGYPYAAQTADAAAVLTMADHERFYRALQEFAEQRGLALRYARKASIKRQRR